MSIKDYIKICILGFLPLVAIVAVGAMFVWKVAISKPVAVALALVFSVAVTYPYHKYLNWVAGKFFD